MKLLLGIVRKVVASQPLPSRLGRSFCSVSAAIRASTSALHGRRPARPRGRGVSAADRPAEYTSQVFKCGRWPVFAAPECKSRRPADPRFKIRLKSRRVRRPEQSNLCPASLVNRKAAVDLQDFFCRKVNGGKTSICSTYLPRNIHPAKTPAERADARCMAIRASHNRSVGFSHGHPWPAENPKAGYRRVSRRSKVAR